MHVMPFPWADYLPTQQAASYSHQINPESLGREEALAAVLDDFGGDRRPFDSAALQRRFGNLCANRRGKHLQRKKLDKKLAGDRIRETPTADHTESVAVKELIGMLQDAVSAADWQILWKLAEGYSCGEVAAQRGISLANLKSRASRSRSRIRNSDAGKAVKFALG